MAGNQKSVDGSQQTGATAIFMNTDMGYDNKIVVDDNQNIVRILVSGTGGREINPSSNRYESSFNQPMSLNLAMLASAQYNLPIRVMIYKDNKITYFGLWVITKCVYKKKGEHMRWVFTLQRFGN